MKDEAVYYRICTQGGFSIDLDEKEAERVLASILLAGPTTPFVECTDIDGSYTIIRTSDIVLIGHSNPKARRTYEQRAYRQDEAAKEYRKELENPEWL